MSIFPNPCRLPPSVPAPRMPRIPTRLLSFVLHVSVSIASSHRPYLSGAFNVLVSSVLTGVRIRVDRKYPLSPNFAFVPEAASSVIGNRSQLLAPLSHPHQPYYSLVLPRDRKREGERKKRENGREREREGGREGER